MRLRCRSMRPRRLRLRSICVQILAGFEGREDQLIEALKRKYGIVKVKVMQSPEEIRQEALTERLTKFFSAFNPARVDAIPVNDCDLFLIADRVHDAQILGMHP